MGQNSLAFTRSAGVGAGEVEAEGYKEARALDNALDNAPYFVSRQWLDSSLASVPSMEQFAEQGEDCEDQVGRELHSRNYLISTLTPLSGSTRPVLCSVLVPCQRMRWRGGEKRTNQRKCVQIVKKMPYFI